MQLAIIGQEVERDMGDQVAIPLQPHRRRLAVVAEDEERFGGIGLLQQPDVLRDGGGRPNIRLAEIGGDRLRHVAKQVLRLWVEHLHV